MSILLSAVRKSPKECASKHRPIREATTYLRETPVKRQHVIIAGFLQPEEGLFRRVCHSLLISLDS